MRTEGRYARNAQIMRDAEKKCSRCRRWGPSAEFPPNDRTSSGLSSWCRECHREAVRAWRRLNRDRENAQRRARTAGRRVAAAR
jgi:hypothetical protein